MRISVHAVDERGLQAAFTLCSSHEVVVVGGTHGSITLGNHRAGTTRRSQSDFCRCDRRNVRSGGHYLEVSCLCSIVPRTEPRTTAIATSRKIQHVNNNVINLISQYRLSELGDRGEAGSWLA